MQTMVKQRHYHLHESAKFRVLCAKNVLACQRALCAYMLLCQRALHGYVLMCQRALRAYVLTCQRALRAHVPMCLNAYVLTY